MAGQFLRYELPGWTAAGGPVGVRPGQSGSGLMLGVLGNALGEMGQVLTEKGLEAHAQIEKARRVSQVSDFIGQANGDYVSLRDELSRDPDASGYGHKYEAFKNQVESQIGQLRDPLVQAQAHSWLTDRDQLWSKDVQAASWQQQVRQLEGSLTLARTRAVDFRDESVLAEPLKDAVDNNLLTGDAATTVLEETRKQIRIKNADDHVDGLAQAYGWGKVIELLNQPTAKSQLGIEEEDLGRLTQRVRIAAGIDEHKRQADQAEKGISTIVDAFEGKGDPDLIWEMARPGPDGHSQISLAAAENAVLALEKAAHRTLSHAGDMAVLDVREGKVTDPQTLWDQVRSGEIDLQSAEHGAEVLAKAQEPRSGMQEISNPTAYDHAHELVRARSDGLMSHTTAINALTDLAGQLTAPDFRGIRDDLYAIKDGKTAVIDSPRYAQFMGPLRQAWSEQMGREKTFSKNWLSVYASKLWTEQFVSAWLKQNPDADPGVVASFFDQLTSKVVTPSIVLKAFERMRGVSALDTEALFWDLTLDASREPADQAEFEETLQKLIGQGDPQAEQEYYNKHAPKFGLPEDRTKPQPKVGTPARPIPYQPAWGQQGSEKMDWSWVGRALGAIFQKEPEHPLVPQPPWGTMGK